MSLVHYQYRSSALHKPYTSVTAVEREQTTHTCWQSIDSQWGTGASEQTCQ